MKKKLLLWAGWCLALSAIPVSLSAQSKTEKKQERAQMVKERMEAKDFEIEVRSALTQGGHSIQLSPYYSLTVRNDSVFSYLPYYGRAYSIPYGGGEGLNFEAEVLDYEQKLGKKGNYEIEFSARTREDYYTFHVDVYDNGASNIRVNMQRKQSIDFIGDLVTEEKEPVSRKE